MSKATLRVFFRVDTIYR